MKNNVEVVSAPNNLIRRSSESVGFPHNKGEYEKLMPLFIPLGLTSPGVAGIMVLALVSGKAGIGLLSSRLLRWHVVAVTAIFTHKYQSAAHHVP
ncbi:hypothetical protein JXO59_10485 [candidate division KSB1 bacterium]|nr:hypothetical protein [candidate division KSB1 bacterium]